MGTRHRQSTVSQRLKLPEVSEEDSMSFFKGAMRDHVNTMDFSVSKFGSALDENDEGNDYMEWDQETNRAEENYEITPEAQDYNNEELEDTKSEIILDDEYSGEKGIKDLF